LEQWRDKALRDGGKAAPLTGEIGRPSIYSIRTATWESRGEVVTHMPLEERLNYAEIYAVIASNTLQMSDEREAWRSLSAFNGLDELDRASVMRLNELLFRAKSINNILRGNWTQALDFGNRLGVRPDPGRRRAYVSRLNDPQFCRSLLRTA
jgi:hypothetical protein